MNHLLNKDLFYFQSNGCDTADFYCKDKLYYKCKMKEYDHILFCMYDDLLLVTLLQSSTLNRGIGKVPR